MNWDEFKDHLLHSQIFWNLDPDRIGKFSNETVIEYVLQRADLPEIQTLFSFFPAAKIKEVWLNRLAADQFQYKNNYFLAFLFFGIDEPSIFLKNISKQNSRLEKLKRIATENQAGA